MAVVVPTISAPTRLWPRRTTSYFDISVDVRRLLGDPFGVIVSDQEIANAIGEAVQAGYPAYVEVQQYVYQWPDQDGTVLLPVTVDAPSSGDVLAIHWEYIGGRTEIVHWYPALDQLHLPSLLPNRVGRLSVDVIESPEVGSSLGSMTTVSRRFCAHWAAVSLLAAWQERTHLPRLEDRKAWEMVAVQEMRISGGSPSRDGEGRYH